MKTSVKKTIVIAVVVLLAVLWQSIGIQEVTRLRSMEQSLEDLVYRRPTGSRKNIKIIGVDEESLAAYGKFEDWSREKLAELIELLSQDPEQAPSVIGLDFLLVGNSEAKPEADARLAEAAKKAGNVVVASKLVYRTAVEKDEQGNSYVDELDVEQIETPYAELAAVTRYGFANTWIDSDGYIRRTRLSVPTEYGVQNSLAYQIYQLAMEQQGKTADSYENMIQFQYSGVSGEYEKVSLVDVLEGEVPVRAFKNCIVLVGAYAPGMQDYFHVAVDHDELMYGVEIHANIVESLQDGKIVKDVPTATAAVLAAVVLAGYVVLAQRQKKLLTILAEGLSVMILWLAAGIVIKGFGWLLPLSVVELGLLLLMVYFVITKYVLEKLEKKRVLKAFERYVAPEIVKELGKDESFESRLGGERRDIAVLFVDIRGFTTMSEKLPPEQVVEILNEYLNLTSQSIFNNQGTLDKFIGDATMAVFNAPVDLDDYVYKAVCAALDMRKGAEMLEKKLTEQFGSSVQFGIGVNCGPAIVGNIGSEKRMDYTAIGDTVNTAARLESNAKRGEILISETVYERLKERIEAEPVGELSLKGKEQKILTYRLLGIK